MRKKYWIFVSSFGVCFATLSWIYEWATQGLWWKGFIAVALGYGLYRFVINHV